MRRRWLAPLTPLYAAGLALRNRRIENGSEPVRRLRFPVVSIGNLSTGGSGKTPLTIALAQALAKRGLHVDVLSRGYGRKSKLTARVNPDGTAEDYGDEPLLIARETGLPVYVAPQRYDAGLLAETDVQSISEQNHQPIVHLLDDGFKLSRHWLERFAAQLHLAIGATDRDDVERGVCVFLLGEIVAEMAAAAFFAVQCRARDCFGDR